MDEETYNPNDPSFLLSRSLDEELSPAEQGKLDDALAASESLREEARQYDSLGRLIRGWSANGAEIDWEHHANLIHAQIQPDGEADELGKLDRLLGRWASQEVDVDSERFTAAVMARVKPESDRGNRHRVIFRLGAPLAAAAAIALVVTSAYWPESVPESRCHIKIGPSFATMGTWDMSEAVVVFGRDLADSMPESRMSGRISFAAVGSASVPEVTEEAMPL